MPTDSYLLSHRLARRVTGEAPDVRLDGRLDDDVAVGVDPIALGVAPDRALGSERSLGFELVGTRGKIPEASATLRIRIRGCQRCVGAALRVEAEAHTRDWSRALAKPIESLLRLRDAAHLRLGDDGPRVLRFVGHLDQG